MMTCENCRWAISDIVDERAPAGDVAVETHLEDCPQCREFAEHAFDLRRRAGVGTAPDHAALTKVVVRNAAAADRAGHSPIIRWLLVLIAAQIVALSVPDFLASDVDGHALAHLGAFSLSYAFGLVVVAVRPARARTMLGVSLVLIAALGATAIVDIVRGRTMVVSEAVHLLELCSAFLLWRLTRPSLGGVESSEVAPPESDTSRGTLRVVRPDDQ